MDALFDLSWRGYPAALLMLLGAGLAVRGLRTIVHSLRGPIALLTGIQGFRIAVIGLALAGIGVAWLWHLPWLLAIAVGVDAEETLESSTYIAVLKGGRRRIGTVARTAAPVTQTTRP